MPSFTDRDIALEMNCDLTRLNVQYTDTVSKVLLDHTKMRWVQRELSKLWSDIEEVTRVFRHVFEPHCTYERYSLKQHFPHSRAEVLMRFESTSLVDAASFEPFTLVTEQLNRVKLRTLSTRSQETLPKMESAVCRVGGAEDGLGRSDCEAEGSRKYQRLEKRERYLARDGVCFSWRTC